MVIVWCGPPVAILCGGKVERSDGTHDLGGHTALGIIIAAFLIKDENILMFCERGQVEVNVL